MNTPSKPRSNRHGMITPTPNRTASLVAPPRTAPAKHTTRSVLGRLVYGDDQPKTNYELASPDKRRELDEDLAQFQYRERRERELADRSDSYMSRYLDSRALLSQGLVDHGHNLKQEGDRQNQVPEMINGVTNQHRSAFAAADALRDFNQKWHSAPPKSSGGRYVGDDRLADPTSLTARFDGQVYSNAQQQQQQQQQVVPQIETEADILARINGNLLEVGLIGVSESGTRLFSGQELSDLKIAIDEVERNDDEGDRSYFLQRADVLRKRFNEAEKLHKVPPQDAAYLWAVAVMIEEKFPLPNDDFSSGNLQKREILRNLNKKTLQNFAVAFGGTRYAADKAGSKSKRNLIQHCTKLYEGLMTANKDFLEGGD